MIEIFFIHLFDYLTQHCNFSFPVYTFTIFTFGAKICNQFTCFPLVFFILVFSSSHLLDISLLTCSSLFSVLAIHSSWLFLSIYFSQMFITVLRIGIVHVLWHIMFFCNYWLHMLDRYLTWYFHLSLLVTEKFWLLCE